MKQEMMGSDISWTTCKSFALHSRQIAAAAPHHTLDDFWSTPPRQISPPNSPIGATTRVQDPKKLKILLKFNKFRNLNNPKGHIPRAIFMKFAAFVLRYRVH